MSLVPLLAIPTKAICERPRRTSRPELRQRLWEQCKHCRYCGRRMRRGAARLDHIRPLSRKGPDVVQNLALCCGQCDQAKQNKTPMELLLWSVRIIVVSIIARVKWIGGMA